MEPHAARPDRALIAILSIIAAIVVIALVVVFTRGGPANVDPTTPEGVVQSYSRAIVDSDTTSALEFLASALRDNCERSEPSVIQELRMTVISSKMNGDTAMVRVTMEYGGGSFGGSGYEYDGVFTLVNEGDLWKIESTPWELALCYDQGISE
ncbi:hypothetical protein FB472_2501 [Rhodoglobus vestalii]|uniref:Lipoprotein LpqB N-terminal domain-containing protein n=1 Tax=Rhodoglobus vestalii TaxID=193384 RepID=A0A8H2KAW0_9MICO|nr:hypothetical protein [Rhodoglobus vestalii]TQO20846.1 hypothetical protein FB472_2501 [Rhodoglobus vestalii]